MVQHWNLLLVLRRLPVLRLQVRHLLLRQEHRLVLSHLEPQEL
jgi:hypothetical protein